MEYIFKAIKPFNSINNNLAKQQQRHQQNIPYFIIFFELNQNQIENFFWYPKICGSAIHDSFVIIIFFAIDSQAVSVNRNVSNDHLVIPLFHNGCVQHVPFVQILVQISKYLKAE